MIAEIFQFVQSIQDGANADPTGTIVLVAIGIVAIAAAIIAMVK